MPNLFVPNLFVPRILVSVLFLSLVHFGLKADAPPEPALELSFADSVQTWRPKVLSFIPHAVRLKKITYESDAHISEEEFCYLTDLKRGKRIAANDLILAMSFLRKKQKFETVFISLEKMKRGYHLHVKLQAFWTLKKVKFEGILLGKEKYSTFYLIEPGERFDQEKHRLSLERITENFKHEGYFNGRVESYLERNMRTKTIMSHIKLHRSKRFYTRAVDMVIKDGGSEQEELRHGVMRFLSRKLKRVAFDKAMINRETLALKKYLARKGFLYVGIQLNEQLIRKKNAVHLLFIITLQQKKEFVFFGNHFFSHEELLNRILLFGRSAWMLPATILSEEIVQAYHLKGFWRVTVEASEEADQFLFLIKEGKRAQVKRVAIKGAQYVEQKKLVKTYFAAFLGLKYFDKASLQRSIDRLMSFYHEEGFLEARVLKQERVACEESCYELVFTIDEGERSYLASAHVAGHPKLWHRGPFLALRKQQKLMPFNSVVLDVQRRWLLRYFQENGYRNVDVRLETDRQGNLIHVTWRIVLGGTPMRFGKTVLQDSSLLSFKAILKQVQYKKGQLWRNDALKRSFVNIKELGVFENVHLYPGRDDPEDEEQFIKLRLLEDDPFEVRLRAGFAVRHVTKRLSTGGATYRAGGSFVVKNPLKSGDQFIADVDFTRVHRNVSVHYKRPTFFGIPIKTLFMGYTNKYEWPGVVGLHRNLYDVTQQGFLLGLSRKLIHVDVGVNIGVEWMETEIKDKSNSMLKMIADIARAINLDARLVDKQVPFFQIEPTAVLDFLDNKLNPTRGMFTVITAKAMMPVKRQSISSYFIKFQAEQSFFIPLSHAVAAIRFRFGHIFHRRFSQIMPIERFYLGGANSLRGYENDYAPPLGVFTDDEGEQRFVPQGGKSMFNANLEIRFRLYKEFGGVVFQDLGVLSKTRFADVTAKDMLAATGFGLRYNTPIGPLRFDIGVKWDADDPVRNRFAWFLSFGQAF